MNRNVTHRIHQAGTALAIGLAAALLATSAQAADPGAPPPVSFLGETSSENSSQVGLEEFFQDPILLGLIQQSLVGNQELKILAEEVQIANNAVWARRGAYLPFVTVGAGALTEKPSRFTRFGAVDNTLDIVPGTPFPNPLPDFLLATNITWQVDIWRQLRNARDAATLRYLGTNEGRNYVVTRLIAEVAGSYYELMTLDYRLEILNQTIALQERSLEVAEANKEAGRGTELAVQRFLAEVRRNQSELLIVKQQIIEVENRINFLAGRFPMRVERDSEHFLDMNMHALSVGLPAQLLLNRPDIRQAELELAAAGLDIKVARANFFPKLAIQAGIGYEAFNMKYLFISPEAILYNVAGELAAPLINKRAIQAEYMTANAVQLQSLYKYQRVVLNAFIEVVNRVSKAENYRRSIEIKREQLKALEESVEVASSLFQNLRAEYIDVLFAQRDLRDARTVLVETKQQQMAAVVNTYQALGGGNVFGRGPLPPLPPIEGLGGAVPAPLMAPSPGPAPAPTRPGDEAAVPPLPPIPPATDSPFAPPER